MMTSVATTESTRRHAGTTAMQKVVIVNASPKMPELLDRVLEAGHYDVVFVESIDHAYSHIKSVQPNLVILCTRMDDAEGFQVLSMLQLDEETRAIPVLTCTCDESNDGSDEEPAEPSDVERFPASKAAVWMN